MPINEGKTVQKKIARICWNSNNWIKPSGGLGKSQDKDSYEYINGYGYEEWLLDTSKLIDGFHYGYLQAIGKHRQKYLNKEFDISLYSINSKTKQHWWIGEILNVKVVTPEESKKVYHQYKENGWYQEMISQLENVGANINEFKKNVTADVFAVIKFTPSDLRLLDQPLEFPHDDPAVTSDYYNLKNKKLDPILIGLNSFSFKAGHNNGKSNTHKAYSDHNSQVLLLHNDLQTCLYNELIKIHGDKNVGTEIACGCGNRIDIVVKINNKFTLYEIKTSLSVKSCIREAIGQLLEYAHFDDTIEINELVIASQNDITHSEQEYLSKLKNLYKLPLAYKKIELKQA